MENVNITYKISKYDLDKNITIDERLILKKRKNIYINSQYSHNYFKKNVLNPNKNDKHY